MSERKGLPLFFSYPIGGRIEANARRLIYRTVGGVFDVVVSWQVDPPCFSLYLFEARVKSKHHGTSIVWQL
jgi:hypothetical protein